ncbi:MAG TPA: glycosyltransferase family 1 protein [Segetibacter sp.]|jgi:glycosyltransferase involved in cell wall biosynthesis
MRIAVNTRFLLNGQLEGYGNFIFEVFKRITEHHPKHQFIFFLDRPHREDLRFSDNVELHVISPKARHALSFKWWYDVKVPLALRKYKADVFVSPDGFCSLFTRVPQVLVVHDLAFLHHPEFIPKHHLLYYKWYTPKFLRKAKVVATVSDYSKKDIVGRYKIAEEKIVNVGSAAKPIFQAVEFDQKEMIKEAYADGFEYFVFVGGIHPRKNLMNLLKAFSLFKTRQHTNMKLLVVGRRAWQYNATIEKLKSYKYRDEVKMLGYLPDDELARVVAGAYALVFPSYFEGFGVPILEAMQSGVPVVTSSTSSMTEIGGDAALYADPNEPTEIADQLKTIFKDETLRSQLIEKGKIQAAKYNWDKTAELMWEAIEQAVTK